MAKRNKPKKPKKSRPKSEPRDRADRVAHAVTVHRSGDLLLARAAYERVLAEDPNQSDALHFLGLLEHQQGRTERGLELMDRSIELQANHPDFHSNRGNLLKLLGRLDEAERDYREVLRLAPDHTNALNNLGTVLRERGQPEAAAELYRRVIALEPEHADAHQNLGNALASLNQFEAALEAHREALRLRPFRGDSYRHLAGMFYALGRIDEAAGLYRRWLELEPEHPIATHMLAACTGTDVPERASNEFVRMSFDQFASSFDRALQRLEYRAPLLVGAALVERLVAGSAGLVVLDAGCGTGLVAQVLSPHAHHLVGVDLSPQMIERARARSLYAELYVAELVEFCAAHAMQYDGIVCADTLVYFGRLDAVFAAMATALRPTGSLVFTVEHAELAQAPAGYRLQPHGRYNHTAEYLRRELASAGFVDCQLEQVALRKEAGKWVDGWLVTARSPAGDARDEPATSSSRS